MYFVYALQSLKDGNLYIGLSQNIEKRLVEHNSGEVKSTSLRRPFKIIYKEQVLNRIAARKREIQLKSGSGREFLKQFIFRSSSVGQSS